MKNYLEFKNKLIGLKEVKETIKAIEKVAASKVYSFKKQDEILKNYLEEIRRILYRLSFFISAIKNSLFLENKGVNKSLLIFITGDKGLAGGYYSNLFEKFLANYRDYDEFIIFGRKGKEFFENRKISFLKYYPFKSLNFEEVEKFLDLIFSFYLNKKFKKIDIIYSSFKSLVIQESLLVTYLPFLAEFEKRKDKNKEIVGLPIFEPKKQQIIKFLTDKIIKFYFYQILMDAKLSELSSRAVAMEKASRETEKIIKKLTNDFLKQRRKELTKAQIEEYFAHKVLNYGYKE